MTPLQKVSSLKDILEFRQTVHLMQTDYPFSKLFGRADKREACVDSSTKVFKRLVDNQLGSANLKFDTLAKIVSPTATKIEASDYQKLKRLITLFRPNKDKELSMIDFIRVRVNTLRLVAYQQFSHTFRCCAVGGYCISRASYTFSQY